jgi:hypothetical protein
MDQRKLIRSKRLCKKMKFWPLIVDYCSVKKRRTDEKNNKWKGDNVSYYGYIMTTQPYIMHIWLHNHKPTQENG